MFEAKEKNKFSTLELTETNVENITKILKTRKIINGLEAQQLIKFKPIETHLDVLYVSTQQIHSELYTKIADEFGYHMDPVLDQTARKNNLWTPKQAIQICLDAHESPSKAWDNGAMILTNSRSECLKNIYASETDLLKSKNQGQDWIRKCGRKVSIYVDPDVDKRFEKELIIEQSREITTLRQKLKEREEERRKTSDKIDLLQIEMTKILAENTNYRNEALERESELEQLKTKKKLVEEGEELSKSFKEIKEKLKRNDLYKAKCEEKQETRVKEEEGESSSEETDEGTIEKNQPHILAFTEASGRNHMATPMKYGMKNPVTSTIFQHLHSIKIGIDQARGQKMKEKQIQNLIYLTIPTEYQFVVDFVTDVDRETTDKFLNKIVELIEGSKQTQLSNFLTVQLLNSAKDAE